MRIRDHGPMTGEVLGNRGHTGTTQTTTKRRSQLADCVGVRMECPVSDDLADAPIQVNTRRKAQVDTGGPQFGPNQPARLLRQFEALLGAASVCAAYHAHRWHRRKTIPESLHPAALMINRNQQRRAPERANLGNQIRDLLRRFVIPGKQDDAADRWLTQQVAVGWAQRDSVYVEHNGP
jgi:hypothetical protein